MSVLTDLQHQLEVLEARERTQLGPQPITKKIQPLATDAFSAGLRTIGSAFDKKGVDITDPAYAYGKGSGELVSLFGKGVGIAGRTLQSASDTPTVTKDPISSGFMQVYARTPKPSLVKAPKKQVAQTWQNLGKKLESYEKPITALGERTKQFYEPLLSDKARELKNTPWYKAQGFGAKVISASLQAAESAPQTAAIATLGLPLSTSIKAAGVASGIAQGLKRIGLNKKWAKNISTWLTEGLAYSTPEGILAGLSSAVEVQTKIQDMTHEDLAQSPKYQEYFKASKLQGEARVTEAKKLLNEDAELFAVGSTMVSSIATGMLTGGGMFGSAGASESFLMRRVLGAAKEGVQEFFQSGPGEKAPQNLAIQLFADPSQEVMEGVWEAALSGAGPGMIMGGVMGSGKPKAQSPIEVLETAQAGLLEQRKKSLAKLRDTKITDADLLQMARSPKILQDYGLTVADIEAQLENKSRAVLELANYYDMLNSAPNEAVRHGIMHSMQGQAAQKLQQIFQISETTKVESKKPEVQKTEDLDGRKEAQPKKKQAPSEKKEITKTTETTKPTQEILKDLKTAEKKVLNLYATQPSVHEAKEIKTEHAETLAKATETVDHLRQTIDQEAKKGYIERRVDTKRRKTVEEMSVKEMQKELLINPLTGIPNKRAIHEAIQQAKEEGKPKSIIFLDADSLKTVNDLGGHAAGDALLQALADSIKEVDPKLGGHISGDEFIILADNAEDAKIKANKLDKLLATKEIVFTLENGDEYTYSGLGASYGIAETIEEADRQMGLHKIEREKAGARVGRGEQPPGLYKTATREGAVDIDKKPEKVATEKESKKKILDTRIVKVEQVLATNKKANLPHMGFTDTEIQDFKEAGLVDIFGFMNKAQLIKWKKESTPKHVKVTKTLTKKPLDVVGTREEKIQKTLARGKKANLAYLGFTYEEIQDLKKRRLADHFGFMSEKQFTQWQKDPAYDPLQIKEKSVSQQDGVRSIEQLTKKETELRARQAEETDLIARGKTDRATAINKYIKTETEAFLKDAHDISLVDRSNESLQYERKLLQSRINWLKKADRRASENRIKELDNELKSRLKSPKTDLILKKDETEYINKAIEKRALIDQLEHKFKSKQKDLDKALKQHKPVKPIRAEITQLETELNQLRQAILAARVDTQITAYSTRDQVIENILKSTGNKTVPSIFKIMHTYADLPYEVKEALQVPNIETALLDGMSLNTLHDSKPAGVHYAGEIYLIAENINPNEDILGLLVHEVGHWLRVNDKVFQKQYKGMLEQVQEIAAGNRTPEEAKAVQLAMQKAMQEENRLNPEQLEEEALMYFLMDQTNVELPWYKKIISIIKQVLFKHLHISPKLLNMSGYDFAQTIVTSIKKDLESKIIQPSLAIDPPMQASPDGTKTIQESNESDRAFFKDIFDNSVEKSSDTIETELHTNEQEVLDTGTESKTSVITKLAVDLQALGTDTTAFKRTKSTQTISIFQRVLGLPEYGFRKNEAANRVLNIALKADELKYTTQSNITILFNEIVESIQELNPKAYKQANTYLLETDRIGKSFSIKQSDTEWSVIDPQNKIIGTSSSEQTAIKLMVQAEQDELAADEVDKDTRTVIREFRELTNRAFDTQINDLQAQINNAQRYGLEEPRIAGEGSPTIADAIAQIGDLRGSYFPRERQNRTYVLRASKKDENNILLTFDAYLPENDESWDTTNQINAVLNANLPIGKKIKELQNKGYEIEGPTLGATPAEEIFDIPGLVSSMDALLKLAEDSTIETDQKAMHKLNRILTKKIAEIYKQKGTLSSRLTRAKDYTEGFETDIIKAALSHAQRVSSGVVKRTVARDMILAFTGRDISFKEYKKIYPEKEYKDYRAFVTDRKIDPTSQKQLYADVKQYIFYILKPDTVSDRAMGYLKALAVMKYLGFRCSSAAVNVTNMFMAVPATIAGHTGISLARASKEITNAITLYTAYRSEQLVFRGESKSSLAKAQTYLETIAKQTGTAITKAAKVELTDADYDIFDKITELGWDQAHFNIEATRALQGYAGNKFNNFLAANMYMFGAAEKANRATTIFAAYKAHKEQHPEWTQIRALNEAKHTSDRAHGIYGKAAKPWIVQHFKPADLFYTFLKFQHNYMLNMVELGIEYKNFPAALHMLLIPAVMSGIGASIATPLIAGLFKLMGFGEDPEEDIYQWAEQNLPDLVKQFPRHGLFGLMNLNFKGSLQMNNPFPTKLSELPGAPGSVLWDTWEAGKHIRYGAYSKGLEKLAPTVLATPIKGLRLITEGLTSQAYAPIYYGQEQLKATPMEVALMTLSFNTARLSGAREKQWRESQVRESFSKEYQGIMKRLKHIQIKYKTVTAQDMASIQERIDDYNFRVERAPARYNIKYLTGKRINQNLKQAFKPSQYEKQR